MTKSDLISVTSYGFPKRISTGSEERSKSSEMSSLALPASFFIGCKDCDSSKHNVGFGHLALFTGMCLNQPDTESILNYCVTVCCRSGTQSVLTSPCNICLQTK